ncbi:MAG: hypothetical protein ACLFQL_06740, partial [Paracoccaceae bacterium]
MNGKPGLGGSASLAILGVAGAAAVALGLYSAGVIGPRPADPPSPLPLPRIDAEPEAGQEQAAPGTERQSEQGQGSDAETPRAKPAAEAGAPAAPPAPPRFDVFRVEPDGTAQLAGRGAPRARVAILLDGARIAEADADAGGSFFTFLTLGTSETPRVLSLSMDVDGRTIASEERVIVAPATAENEQQEAVT